MFGLLSLF